MLIRVAVIFTAIFLFGCAAKSNSIVKPDFEQAAKINAQLGLDYLRMGKLELAEEKLGKALDQDKDNPSANLGMGLTMSQLGDSARAEQYLQKAVKLSPKDPYVLNSFGAMLCEQGKVFEAAEYFEKAIANNNYATSEVPLTNGGMCWKKAGSLTIAEQWLRRAIQANPNYAEALLQLASLKLDQGEILNARGFLQRYEQASGGLNIDGLVTGIRIERALGNQDQQSLYEAQLKRLAPKALSQLEAEYQGRL